MVPSGGSISLVFCWYSTILDVSETHLCESLTPNPASYTRMCVELSINVGDGKIVVSMIRIFN